MIKIENVEVVGWEAAIRGMRNPMNSWAKSDSRFSEYYKENADEAVGDNDLDLMKRLSQAGTDHSKYLRMIVVYADIVAPDYWFKEFSTYRVGVTENSTSTMHKIQAKEFALEDFSCEHLDDDMMYPYTLEPIDIDDFVFSATTKEILNLTIQTLNWNRIKFLETKDKMYWWQMIQLLPMSYNYRRTVCMNYQVLKNMYHSRKNHKLDEWQQFCRWIESLPYAEIIIE